jgi:mono/diheme cytochrome c family protein
MTTDLILPRTLLALIFLAGLTGFTGCVQKMGKDGHIRAYDLMPRAEPAGTVSQEELRAGSAQAPTRLTRAMAERGRKRYDIYCSACHGYAGYGDGMVVQRGFLAPPSFHSKHLIQAPNQHFFDVMTHGIGSMYGYGEIIPAGDCWAIVAYIRALQKSQNIAITELSPPLPPELKP